MIILGEIWAVHTPPRVISSTASTATPKLTHGGWEAQRITGLLILILGIVLALQTRITWVATSDFLACHSNLVPNEAKRLHPRRIRGACERVIRESKKDLSNYDKGRIWTCASEDIRYRISRIRVWRVRPLRHLASYNKKLRRKCDKLNKY